MPLFYLRVDENASVNDIEGILKIKLAKGESRERTLLASSGNVSCRQNVTQSDIEKGGEKGGK